jgi:ABC-type uncharacterized transport system permease subunit
MKWWVSLIVGAVSALTFGFLQKGGLNFWLAVICGVALGFVVGLIFRLLQKKPL